MFLKKRKNRVAVFSIDGLPYTFLEQMCRKGKLPNLSELFRSGTCRQMNSVYPTISSVAWASFMTGVNPGMHNVYGFVDRDPNPFGMYIPTSRALKVRTLWELLSAVGKKVVVINVPVTYPPREVNGVLIGCFLATKIEKAVYPPEYAEKLKQWKYRIDVDAWLGRKDKDKFMEDLFYTLGKRVETAFKLMESEEWDYFHLHIMESDRICHFLWEDWEKGDAHWAPQFENFFAEIDRNLGEFKDRLPAETKLIVMSDHGFCGVKKEVYLNQWLRESGYLSFSQDRPESLNEITPQTSAYSLIPGRIFINLKGREWAGTVEAGKEYYDLCEKIRAEIKLLKEPSSGEQMVEKTFLRNELYRGTFLNRAADIIVIPNRGYDFKGDLCAENLTLKGELQGMHTFDDAFLYVDGMPLAERKPEIIDVLPTIFSIMKVEVPKYVEGKNLLV